MKCQPPLRVVFLAAAALFITFPPLHGQVVWDDEAGDNLWLTPENWVGDTIPGTTETGQFTSSDTVSIGGTTTVSAVNATGAGTVANVNIGSGNTLLIRNNSGSAPIVTDWTTSGGQLNLNVSGGTFAGDGSGPTGSPAGGGIYGGGGTTINLTSGVVERFGRLRGRGGLTVNVSGGTFRVNDSFNDPNRMSLEEATTSFTLSGTAALEFSIVDETDYFFMDITSASVNLAGGTITFNAPTYTPQAGHSFDFINGTFTAGAAISPFIGGAEVVWDTSQWPTDGILTIQTVIPEPSTAVLLLGGIGMIALRRRVRER